MRKFGKGIIACVLVIAIMLTSGGVILFNSINSKKDFDTIEFDMNNVDWEEIINEVDIENIEVDEEMVLKNITEKELIERAHSEKSAQNNNETTFVSNKNTTPTATNNNNVSNKGSNRVVVDDANKKDNSSNKTQSSGGEVSIYTIVEEIKKAEANDTIYPYEVDVFDNETEKWVAENQIYYQFSDQYFGNIDNGIFAESQEFVEERGLENVEDDKNIFMSVGASYTAPITSSNSNANYLVENGIKSGMSVGLSSENSFGVSQGVSYSVPTEKCSKCKLADWECICSQGCKDSGCRRYKADCGCELTEHKCQPGVSYSHGHSVSYSESLGENSPSGNKTSGSTSSSTSYSTGTSTGYSTGTSTSMGSSTSSGTSYSSGTSFSESVPTNISVSVAGKPNGRKFNVKNVVPVKKNFNNVPEKARKIINQIIDSEASFLKYGFVQNIRTSKLSFEEQQAVIVFVACYYGQGGNLGKMMKVTHVGNLYTKISINILAKKCFNQEREYIYDRIDRELNKMYDGDDLYVLNQISKYVAKQIKYTDGERDVIDALKNKEGVCIVYAMLFKMMGERAGINTDIICGFVEPNREGRHAWNACDTDAGRRYYDITWFDDEKGNYNYKYFNSAVPLHYTQKVNNSDSYWYVEIYGGPNFK